MIFVDERTRTDLNNSEEMYEPAFYPSKIGKILADLCNSGFMMFSFEVPTIKT